MVLSTIGYMNASCFKSLKFKTLQSQPGGSSPSFCVYSFSHGYWLSTYHDPQSQGLRAEYLVPLVQGPPFRCTPTPILELCNVAQLGDPALLLCWPCWGSSLLPRTGQQPRPLALEHGRTGEIGQNSTGCIAKGLCTLSSQALLHLSNEMATEILTFFAQYLEHQLSGQVVEFIPELQNAEQRNSEET